MNPKIAEYVTASQAGLQKAADELAQSQATITSLTTEKQAGVGRVQKVVDALVNGGKIHDKPEHRKAAAAKLATFAGAMEMLESLATFEPEVKSAASLGSPVPGPNAAPPAANRNGMSPNPQAGLEKLAGRLGVTV